MDIIQTFSDVMKKQVDTNPERARWILRNGYRAYRGYNHVHPDKKLPESRRYAADVVMKSVIKALSKPEGSCMCSLFVPGEMMAAAEVNPYSVEALSCYLAGTHIEKVFLDITAEQGIPETMCSFHRVFLGAADSGLMPIPPFMVYTNLVCDGNMLTFPFLKEKYHIPAFYIDVPWEKNQESVNYVADQLRELAKFLTDMTGNSVTEEKLRVNLERSNRVAANYKKQLEYRRTNHLAGIMTSEMYEIFFSRIFGGTEEAEKYAELLLRDAKKAPASDALRIAWVHLMPFMQPSMRDLFNYSQDISFTAADLTCDGFQPVDAEDPFNAMAQRMVYSIFNGSAQDRADFAVNMAKECNADWVIMFAHWGCKSTIGATGIMRDALDEQGIPSLILDGDGCCPANSADGQMRTRAEAFLEMLKVRREGGEAGASLRV